MFILKKGHQPGVYVPLRALFLVANVNMQHYGYQGIITDAGGKTIKSQNPEKIKQIQSIFLFHVITNFVNMADR